MRVLVDYRPALRSRTGAGEYAHQLARALADGPDDITAFTSSWKDRPSPRARAELLPVRLVDCRVPVRVLNFAWHRLGWPPVERLAGGRYDVVHAVHPLLIPATDAARLVTVHDLDFLVHPQWCEAEVRRDYPALARSHARRADAVIVPSSYTARLVRERFGVAADRLFVCPPAVPADWRRRDPGSTPPAVGYILFVGTMTGRKNIAGLLAGYSVLAARRPGLPDLVLAGRVPAGAGAWLEQIGHAPLSGRVERRGYVAEAERLSLFEGARLLVLPSFDEGFGLPALEAMALGIPVVVSNRGALPDLVGEAGLVVDPDRPEDLAAALDRLLADPGLARELGARGIERSRAFTWARTAALVRTAYDAATAWRTGRSG